MADKIKLPPPVCLWCGHRARSHRNLGTHLTFECPILRPEYNNDRKAS